MFLRAKFSFWAVVALLATAPPVQAGGYPCLSPRPYHPHHPHHPLVKHHVLNLLGEDALVTVQFRGKITCFFVPSKDIETIHFYPTHDHRIIAAYKVADKLGNPAIPLQVLATKVFDPLAYPQPQLIVLIEHNQKIEFIIIPVSGARKFIVPGGNRQALPPPN